jgi:hypothetical protein
MAGYSGTPLPRKLGIKPGSAVALLGAPAAFEEMLAPLPQGVTIQRADGGAATASGAAPSDPAPGGGHVSDLPADTQFDVIVGFTTRRDTLARWVRDTRPALKPAGGLWIAWPKRAARIATEVTEDTVRELALPTGLVDNKVCAIDDTWTGLRLVVRRELRPKA